MEKEGKRKKEQGIKWGKKKKLIKNGKLKKNKEKMVKGEKID